MIQRKQSIYLLLAALLSAGLFFFNIYNYHIIANGLDVAAALKIGDHYPSLIIAILITIIPLVTIFLFNNRKRQILLSSITIVAIIGFIALQLWRVNTLGSTLPAPTNNSYGVAAILPLFSLILLFMAISGIRKDDKLVKSVDRLR